MDLLFDQRLSEPVLCYISLFLPLILMFSTLIIAAAGYMINDYFDIGIDAINKPHKVTIEKIFKRRSIIIAHVLLNTFAMGMAIWAALGSMHPFYLDSIPEYFFTDYLFIDI